MNKRYSERTLAGLLCCAMLLLGVGCGADGPDVVKLHGRITKGGRPVSHVVLQFFPQQGRPSAGRTDAEGRYAPEFSQEIGQGVLPGKCRVSIQVAQERIDEPINLRDAKYHPDTAEIVKVFGDWNQTPLQIDVSHDQPETNIELDDHWPSMPAAGK